MSELVSVKIEYIGCFVQLLERREDSLEVPVLLSKTVSVILQYIVHIRNINMPFTLLLNGCAVSLILKKEKERWLEEGDQFRIVPITTGG